MTMHPPTYSGSPSPASGDTGTPARQFTEPVRELAAMALLGGNAIFLLIGVLGLFFVIDNWAADFALRSTEEFGRFIGPVAVGLPILALLLATHVRPMVPRTRLILIVVLTQFGVSAFFGAIAFLGAFAYNLHSGRMVVSLLERFVWLGFLVLACVVATRVWLGLFPASKAAPFPAPVPAGYRPTYGKPYPGQPLYPQPTQPAGSPTDAGVRVPDNANGWPIVPPPPGPAPLVMEADPTMRISLPRQAEILGGEETQVVPAPLPAPSSPTQPSSPPQASSPTQPTTSAEPSSPAQPSSA